MAAAISAFEATDGALFRERKQAENHDLMIMLKEKFGDKTAVQLQVIIDERDWLEQAFAKVKKDHRPSDMAS